jgi:hypothetical protein
LCPAAGGVLELSGVFNGRFNFSRSAAFSARNFVLSARSAALSASNAANRDTTVAISASFSALDNERESGRVIHRLTHATSSHARKIHSLTG